MNTKGYRRVGVEPREYSACALVAAHRMSQRYGDFNALRARFAALQAQDEQAQDERLPTDYTWAEDGAVEFAA